MNDPHAASVNFAAGSAHVGVQAQKVDGGIAYATVVLGDASFAAPPGASREEKYQIGLNNLSSGMVTNFSTSSALRPGHWVMMVISVLVTSGKASMGMDLKVMIPQVTRAAVVKKMKYLFFKEKARILLSTLCMARSF